MSPSSQNFWEALFPAQADLGQAVGIQMRLLNKGGRPFLLLPGQSRPAAATMDLYPAQTGRARVARSVLRWLLRASLAPGSERVSLVVASGDPFAAFLSSLAGEPRRGLPVLGILAGNPMSEGQRLLVLVFDARQEPVAVVKAGLSERARALVEQEESFLAAVPPGTKGVPRLRGAFKAAHLRALALDFFAGDSPRPEDEAALPGLLESWIDQNKRIAVSDTPDWRRLEQAGSENRLFPSVASQLRGRTIASVIQHGDFAPWNIKISPGGSWTILDWERGELTGIPGWDWFHYVIQSAILVGRLPTGTLVERVEGLLASAALRQYAALAGIEGCVRDLVRAYLLYVVEVIKPSEGLEATLDLLRALSARWQPA
jgi:hypothetical protein